MGKRILKTTDKQTAANQANARKSTGPITPGGKAKAARNALKHGLLAKEVVIDDGEGAESREEFEAVLLDLHQQFDPQGPLEEILVEKIAVAYWRLRRVHRYEVGLARKKLDHAIEEYYTPNSFNIDDARIRDNQIDAEITQRQESCQQWQEAKEQFTKMHDNGEDLQSIYDWEENWELLCDEEAETLTMQPEESPASIRESLHEAGWTDDDIWRRHIKICDEQIAVLTRSIQRLQKQKQENGPAIQILKKLSSVPDTHDLDRLLKYEGAIERGFYRAIDQLERLQRLRAGHAVPPPVNINVAVNPEDAVSNPEN
jgi:hypothetical protein